MKIVFFWILNTVLGIGFWIYLGVSGYGSILYVDLFTTIFLGPLNPIIMIIYPLVIHAWMFFIIKIGLIVLEVVIMIIVYAVFPDKD